MFQSYNSLEACGATNTLELSSGGRFIETLLPISITIPNDLGRLTSLGAPALDFLKRCREIFYPASNVSEDFGRFCR